MMPAEGDKLEGEFEGKIFEVNQSMRAKFALGYQFCVLEALSVAVKTWETKLVLAFYLGSVLVGFLELCLQYAHQLED